MPVLMLNTVEWMYLVAEGVAFPQEIQPWRVNKLLKGQKRRPYHFIGITAKELAILHDFVFAQPEIPLMGHLRHKITLAIRHNPKLGGV